LIRAGELGRIEYISSSRLNLGKLRTEEDILWSFAPHDISAIVHLLEVNPTDATAHFLLGSFYLSGDMAGRAMDEWEITQRLKPATPGLQRNMGYTVLYSEGSPERAIELFREGIKYDSSNVDIYLGLDEAMQKASRSASERVKALQRFPDLQGAPGVLVFQLVQLLEEIGEFDQAENLLTNRFFAREEGGANIREVYVNLKLRQSKTLAAKAQCPPALKILDRLGEPVANLPFTQQGLASIISSKPSQRSAQDIRQLCH
jgi:tetratricopeptide (TPR) repeat protein